MKNKAEVPFDQFSRQKQVSLVMDICRKLGKQKTYSILDVGGYKGRTAEFLSDDNVTVLDLYEVDEENYVKGSALKMPFKDKSFDFVVNFDVLEHIPAEKRDLFLSECSRVACKGIIIAAPSSTPANIEAEIKLNKLYKTLHGTDHEWLKEHIEYKIPDFDEVREKLERKDWSCVSLPSNDSIMWTMMQGAIFLNSKYPIAAETLVKLNDLYNESYPLDGGTHPKDSYRNILVALKDKSATKQVEDYFNSSKVEITNQNRIDQISEVFSFVETLLKKTSQEAANYKKLYDHELKRSTQLQKKGEDLWRRITELEADIQKHINQKLSEKIRRKLRKDK